MLRRGTSPTRAASMPRCGTDRPGHGRRSRAAAAGTARCACWSAERQAQRSQPDGPERRPAGRSGSAVERRRRGPSASQITVSKPDGWRCSRTVSVVPHPGHQQDARRRAAARRRARMTQRVVPAQPARTRPAPCGSRAAMSEERQTRGRGSTRRPGRPRATARCRSVGRPGEARPPKGRADAGRPAEPEHAPRAAARRPARPPGAAVEPRTPAAARRTRPRKTSAEHDRSRRRRRA